MRSKYEDPDFDDRMVEYSEEDSDDERPKAKARKQAAPKAGGGAQRKAPKRPAGTVTLRGLIEEGLLAPADDVLTVEYKGMITHASLTAEGRIRFKDMYFDSPSAFSIYLKRLVNPTRKADDGWKTVKYAGKLLETFKMEFFMRRFGGLEGAPPGVAAAAAGLGPNAGMPPTKRARTNAAAAAAAAGGVFDDPAAAGLGGSGSSSVGGPPTTLRQLAPRCRGSGQPVAGFRGGPGAAAAAGGSSSMGGGGGAGLRSEHTPRPVDLGSMVPAEHDYAPREGELAGMGEQEVVALTPGAPRHFMSGVELEAVTNGLPTPSSSEAPYTPAQPTPAADQPPPPPPQQQQQQPGSEADAAAAAADESEGAAGGATVAASRPRRAIKMPQRLINSAAMADRDGHDMVRCEGYPVGPPGCGAPGAQPYRVAVSPIAEVMMDFHAHLDRNEIIGLLAGSWDPQQRLLRVERAFPVREAMGGNAENDGINVEMDPEDQFKVTEVINELYGMRVVGWYHSHPSFPALPSVIDIANQLQMQQQYKTDEGGVVTEPYIAAIVSPYDRRLPSLQSSVTWFRVEQGSPAAAAAAAAAGSVGAAAGAVAAAAGRLTFASNKDAVDQGAVPVELAIERLLRRSTPDALVKLIPALIITAQRYAAKRSAPNLTSSWKPPTLAVAAVAAATAGEVTGGAAGAAAAAAAAAGSNGAGGGQAQGPGQTLVNTRLIKLMGSLKAWWPGNATAEQCQEFCNALKRALLQSRVLVAVPGLVDSPPQQQQQQHPRPPVALSGPAAAAAAAALAAALPSAGGAQLLPQLQQVVSLPMQQQQQQQYLASSLERVLAAGATGSSKAGSAGSSPNAASAAAAAAAATAAMAAAVAAAQPPGPSRLAAALMGQAADASTGGAAALEGTDAVAGMQQQLPPQQPPPPQQQQQGDDEATATETEDEADAAVPGPPPLAATEAAAEQGQVAGDVSLFAPAGQVSTAAAEPAPPVAAAAQQQQGPAEDADEATEDEADAQ